MNDQNQAYQTGQPPYPAPPNPNAFSDRFTVLGDPWMRAAYEEQARRIGLQFNNESRLSPLVNVQSSPIALNSATDPGVAISLNPDIPELTVQYVFQDPAFVRRVSASLIGLVLTAIGQNDPSLVGESNPLDYVYVQFERAGDSDRFQTERLPLSHVAGVGEATYFYDLIPALRKSSQVNVAFSIIPPGAPRGIDPPYVRRCGQITLAFHTERFNPFGV